MTRLAVTLDATGDESWHSYLSRTAAANHCSLRDVAHQAGLLNGTTWPAFFGVVIADKPRALASQALGISELQVEAMQLSAYDRVAFDLTALRSAATPTSSRAAAQQHWILFTGSRFCPRCLARDAIWKLTWRLPWITCCDEHHQLLAYQCPDCAMVVRTGRATATTSPIRATRAQHERLCGNALAGGYGGTCSADLTTVSTRRTTPAENALDQTMRAVLHNHVGTVTGAPWPALDCLGSWQRVACFALALRAVSGSSATRRPWLQAPRDQQVMLGLLGAAAPVLLAASPREAAETLTRWCAAAHVNPSPATFRDCAPPNAALQPALARCLGGAGRSHSVLLRHLDQIDGRHRLQLTAYDIDDIPQLAWPCALPPAIRHSSAPSEELWCAVLSLFLSRIAGARHWAQAAQTLGWQPHQGRQWVRYTCGGERTGLRPILAAAALALAGRLSEQPTRHGWAERPILRGRTAEQLRQAQAGGCSTIDASTPWCPCRSAAAARRTDRLSSRQGAATADAERRLVIV